MVLHLVRRGWELEVQQLAQNAENAANQGASGCRGRKRCAIGSDKRLWRVALEVDGHR